MPILLSLLFAVLLLAVPSTAHALDLPQYVETKVVGGTASDYGNTIEKDSQGNLYIGGNFGTGTLDFDPGTGVDNHTNAGAADMFLTKYNADGTYAWTKTWGGTGSESLYNIAFDSSDNIYLATEFGSTIDLNPNSGIDSYTSAGSVDIALIKLTSDGEYVYSKVMGSTSHDRLHTVQYSTSDGFIYIAGKFTGNVDFDPSGSIDTKNSAGNYDAYLTKFNTDGTYVWTKTWGDTDRDTVNDIALDSSGNIYLAGVFRNTVNFDTTGGTDNKTSAGLDDAFLTRYNADGTYGWTKTWGSTANDFSFNIRVSPSNDVYIVGSYQLTVDFDPSGVTNNLTSAGSEDSYVSKFESDGTYDLTYAWGGSLMDEVNAITFDSAGNYYIGGFFNGSIDMDPTSGTSTIASNGLYDQFFSVFDQNDQYLTTKTFGSSTEVNWFDEILYELYASGTKLYVTGFYNATTDFDPGSGTDNRTSAGGWDIYYSTYNLDYTSPIISAVNPISTSTSSTITWTTNELASSIVEYGLTSGYGTSTTETNTTPRVLSHSATLPGLIACTTYHYRVKSTDASTNTTTGSDNTFTTGGCVGSTSAQGEAASIPSTPLCTDEQPSEAPDLFQADSTSTSIKIFFTPISNTNTYHVSYSSKPSAEEHGVEVTLEREGVQNYMIHALKPRTTYYFKVRGQHGCMPGDWSGVMKIATRSQGSLSALPSYKYAAKNQSPVFTQEVTTLNATTKNMLPPSPKTVMGASDEKALDTITVTSAPTKHESPTAPQREQPQPTKTCFLWMCW